MTVFKEESDLLLKSKTSFEAEDSEAIIDYYQPNPFLWNPNLTPYRYRESCDVLLEKLVTNLMEESAKRK